MIRRALGVAIALLLAAGPAIAQESVILRKPDNSAAVDPANAGNQASEIAGLTAIAAAEAPISGVTSMTTDGTTYTAGRSFQAECTVAGNVKVTFTDASQRTVPLNPGVSILPYAVTAWTVSGVSGPATCTYANLK